MSSFKLATKCCGVGMVQRRSVAMTATGSPEWFGFTDFHFLAFHPSGTLVVTDM